MDTKSAASSQLTEHITHARLVHFALVTLSFLLLSGWTLNRSSDVARAHQQLGQVESALQMWDPAWLHDLVRSRAESFGRPSVSRTDSFYVATAARRGGVRLVARRSWVFRIGALAEEHLYGDSALLYFMVGPPGMERRAPARTDLVHLAWEGIDPHAVRCEWTVGGDGATPLELRHSHEIVARWKQKHDRHGWMACPRIPSDLSNRDTAPIDGWFAAFAGFEVPLADSQVGAWNGQLAFIHDFSQATAGGPSRRPGSFEQLFPELQRLSKHLDRLSLSQLDSVLAAEVNRAGDKVEALGMKLPAEAIAFWGIPVVLLVQLYLLLHLGALTVLWERGVFDPIPPVAWIGPSRRLTARISSLASAVVFPTFVCLFLALKQGPHEGVGTRILLSVEVMMAASLALLIARQLQLLWLPAAAAVRAADAQLPSVFDKPKSAVSVMSQKFVDGVLL